MAFSPTDKTPGNPLLSQDWNAHVHETIRLETDKVNRSGDTITGDLTINGALKAASLVVQGAITPNFGNSPQQGIMFPTDPAGGSGDSAYMRYYVRSGEALTLEIGITNDANDHVALMPSGNVGVGTINPQAKLTIQQGPTDAAAAASNRPLFVSGNLPSGRDSSGGGIEFRHDNLTQGIGFGFSTIYATGSNPNQELALQSRGASPLLLNPNGGNIGINRGNALFPIHFPAVLGNKIALWGEDANANYGLGIQANTLQIYGDAGSSKVAFGWGSSSNFHETLRVEGDGSVFARGHLFLHAYEGDGVNGTAYVQGRDSTGKTSIGLVLRTTINGTIHDAITMDPNGTTHIPSLTGIQKFFRIDHPEKAGHDLIHACMEGPENGVYYRGTAQLVNGEAVISLPDYFEALTRQENRTVQLTPQGGKPFLMSAEEVAGGSFKVHGTEPGGAFCWEVKAVRADVPLLEAEVEKPEAASLFAKASDTRHSLAAKG